MAQERPRHASDRNPQGQSPLTFTLSNPALVHIVQALLAHPDTRAETPEDLFAAFLAIARRHDPHVRLVADVAELQYYRQKD